MTKKNRSAFIPQPLHRRQLRRCTATALLLLGAAQAPAQGLVPAFSGSPLAGPAPLVVQFTDQSTTDAPGGVTAWSWDFDDDGVPDSTAQNPSFAFLTTGVHPVRLTVSDPVHAPRTTMRSVAVGTRMFGLVNAPIGTATLQAATSTLTVHTSNDGDGVSVRFGESSGGCVGVLDPHLGNFAPGDTVQFDVRGYLAGGTETSLARVVNTATPGGGSSLSLVAGAQFQTFDVEAYNGDHQVYQGAGSGSGAVASSTTCHHWFDCKHKRPVRCSWPANNALFLAQPAGPDTGELVLTFDAVTSITIGGATVLADRLRLVPTDTVQDAVAAYTGIDVSRTGSLTALQLDGEMLFQFAGMATALGGAGLDARSDGMTLSTGSGPVAGVTCMTCGAAQQNVEFDPVDLATAAAAAPVGATLTAEAFGGINGLANASLGRVRATKTATDVAYSADLTNLGSATSRVVVTLGGAAVVERSGMSGTLARCQAWPQAIHTNGAGSSGYGISLSAPLSITVPGVGAVLGDGIAVFAETPGLVVGLKDRMDVQFTGLPRVRMLDVRGEPTLTASSLGASLSAGGTVQTLDLNAGAHNAGMFYVEAVSFSAPVAFPFLGWLVPLVPDYLNVGVLDAQGNASLSLVIPAGLPPSYAGFTLHRAVAVVDVLSGRLAMVTNAVPLTLLQ